jgi:AAA domain
MTTVKKRRVKRDPEKLAREQATAEVREFLEISDLASYMRGEIKPPEMLVEDWLQKGVLHWMQGHPEDGKSWVALWCAVKLLQQDEDARVLLMDGEMGVRTVGERLHALGLDPGTAQARFTHVNLDAVAKPQWQNFVVWAHAMRFTLVIWDPIAHHLAGADLNEDSNADVMQWLAQVVGPVLNTGATVIGVDHLPKNGDNTKGYARGAGVKRSRSRVVYEFDKKQAFDRTMLGELIVDLVKNSDAAEIPTSRAIVLGGKEGSTDFVLRVSPREVPEAKNRTRDDARAVVDKAVAILEKLPPGTELSANKLATDIGGNRRKTLAALNEAGTTTGGQLNQHTEEQGKRLYAYYSLRTENGLR